MTRKEPLNDKIKTALKYYDNRNESGAFAQTYTTAVRDELDGLRLEGS